MVFEIWVEIYNLHRKLYLHFYETQECLWEDLLKWTENTNWWWRKKARDSEKNGMDHTDTNLFVTLLYCTIFKILAFLPPSLPPPSWRKVLIKVAFGQKDLHQLCFKGLFKTNEWLVWGFETRWLVASFLLSREWKEMSEIFLYSKICLREHSKKILNLPLTSVLF